MTKDDLTGGIKNAVQHGATIEKAVQSFINAGYNPAEVKQAADSLSQGVSTITNPVKFKDSSSTHAVKMHKH